MLAATLQSLAGLRVTDAGGRTRTIELLPPERRPVLFQRLFGSPS